MRFTLFALASALVLDFANAGTKQCRIVHKRAAQLPFTIPPRSTSPATRSAATRTPAGTAAPTATTETSIPTATESLTSTSTSAGVTAVPTGFDYSKDKIRGVNLGGWLGV